MILVLEVHGAGMAGMGLGQMAGRKITTMIGSEVLYGLVLKPYLK